MTFGMQEVSDFSSKCDIIPIDSVLAKVNNPRWWQNVPQLWRHTNYCINEFFSALHKEDHYVPCGGADRLLVVCVCAALDTGRTGDCCCC